MRVFKVKTPLSPEFSDRKSLALLFSAGFIVRFIPEMLAWPHPIGFDTIYYAFVMKNGVVWPHWSSFFTSSWLFHAISVSLYKVFGSNPFILLKVLAPILFGLNVAGIFWFARKMLSWGVRISLLAGFFFALQLASVRISWDLLRNTLGLGILLFTLPFIKTLNSNRGFACFVLLSLFSVFAHEYVAVTLLFIVFSLVLWSKLKGEELTGNKRLFLAVSPALTVFSISLYLRLFPIRYKIETNVLNAGDTVYASVGSFFLTNYLSVKTSVDWYASYFDLFLSVTALFSLLYLPYIFFVWKGLFQNQILSCWTALLLIGSFGCVVFPFCALQYWHRWMFMLVYPFTFYAVNGFTKYWRNHKAHGNLYNRKVCGVALLTVLVGCAYLGTPVYFTRVFTADVNFYFPPVYKYISFAPTVPYEDVDDVVGALEWLDKNMDERSCVLLQHAFLWWGKLYLGNERIIVHFENDVDLALDSAFDYGFSNVYFVWWNTPIGWYGITVPEGFVRLWDFGRISVYKFCG
ncbi:MAG: hypothetical protein QXI91_04145 [Candidatus Bathyarchaeia archaeon]